MITCYAQPDKPKSRRVLEAFAAGCGGQLSSTASASLLAGAAAFYGVRPGWMHLFDQARRESRPWYWLDNAWFDASREICFRIGVNAVQSWTRKPSDGRRLAALGIRVQPWRRAGRQIVVCPQSDEFLSSVAHRPHWLAEVQAEIRQHSDRPVTLRSKGCSRPLAQDLQDAWLLITHSSAAAVEALLAGVSVIVTDPACAAAEFASRFEDIEMPRRAEGRAAWAARLADSQWTLDEIRSGLAWRALCSRDG